MALTDAQAKIINRNRQKKNQNKQKAAKNTPAVGVGSLKIGTGTASALSPLELARKDAATKTTVRDKVNYAKQSGAVEKTNVQKSVQANQKKQEAKSQARSQLTLSESDLSLPSLSKKGILDAKLSWGEAYNAGDKGGMAKAHADAEKIRSRYGYSGGSSGSEKIEGPGLTEKDKVTLNQSGQQALLSALTLGDKERAEEVRKAKGFQATDFSQKKDGEGRTIFSQTKEEQEKAGDQFLAGLEAAGKGFAGSLLSVHETFNQAMRNYNRDRWGRNLQANANQTRDKALADASRKVLESATIVDPNLPGQTLLRESQEAAAEALEGKTGLSALLTKAGISSAQMLPGIAASFIPGVGPAVGATILGAQAAGSRMGELNEQSRDARTLSYIIGGDPRDYGEVTPGESFGRGLVSGAIEGIAERLLPIKNLLNIVKGNGGASLLVNVAKQAGMEATEESASYILNYAADRLAQDPNAQLSMKDLAEAAAVGAISGAGFGAGGSVINTAINANRGKPQTTERTGQDILLEAAGVKAPEAPQNEPEQMFERNQGEILGETETPVRAIQEAEKATPDQEGGNRAMVDRKQRQLAKLEADRVKISDRIERYVRDYAETRDGYYLEQLTAAQRAADDIAAQIEAIESGEEVARSVGSAAGGFDPYSRMMNEYGTHSPGESPARMLDVPISTDGQDRVSQFARNVMEAGNTTEATVERLQQMIVDKGFSYRPRKDRDALQNAVKTIETKGFDGAYQQWNDVVEGRRTAGKDDMVLAQTLYIEAEQAGDSQTSARLAAEIAAEATRMGQGLQALRLLKKTTKEGKAYYIRKTVENIRKEAANRTKKDVSGITVDEGLMQKFLVATTKEEEDAALDAVYLDVARKVPANWTDRANAWRYFAMLSNPRTHFRNVLGNVIWGGLLKGTNTVSTGLQALMLPAEKRTRAIKATPAAKEFAKQDYEAMKDVLSGGKYESSGSALERQIQRNALGPLSKVTNKVSDALEKEDMWAKKPAYIRSLARFITVRGWNPATMTADQLELARNQAIKDAREATFTDASALASALSDFERTNTATRLLVGGVMPFKGVPINITKQAYNLSPFGLMTSTVDMLRKVRRGDETAAEAIDKFAKGLSGTSIAAVGAFLAAQGILNAGASDDEKERALDEASGSQAYSLDLSAIPFDKIEEVTGLPVGDFSIPYTYTIDWAAPSIVPLVIGAELYNVWTAKDEAENGEDADDSKRLRLVLEALSRSFDLLAEMTTFSGLGGTLRSASYSENGFLPAVVGNVLGNYAGQFIPTPVGALARTIDDIRRSTYTDKDSPIPVGLQKFVQQQANKIPGLSEKSVPFMDVWGREDKQENLLLRALENFVSPGYGAKVEDAEATQEVERLGDLGYRNALLGVLSKGQKVDLDGDGKEERLTREQWEAWNRTRGEAALDLIGEIIGSDNYKVLSDKDKAAVVERIYDYATLLGKESAGADTSEFDGWFFGAKEAEEKVGMSAAKFIELYTQKGMIDSANKDLDKNTKQGLFESYVDSRTDLTDEQKAYLKNNIKFYQMIPADASSYNKAVEAGYTTPESIEALLSGKKEYDFDGNASYTNTEMYAYISSLPEGEQEMAWNALRSKGTTKSWATLKSEEAPKLAKQQKAQETLNGSMEADRQTVFANAISEYGTGSRYAVYQALMSIDATDAERQTYYNYVNAKKGWKASWAQMKANGGYP